MAVRREAVRLELEDAFTRDMLAAAAATKLLERSLKDLDGTSVGAGHSVDGASDSLRDESKAAGAAEKATTRHAGATKDLTLEQAIAEEKTRRLASSIRDQARASVNAEEGIQGLSGRTREYSLETAIAEERARRASVSLREEARAAVDAEQGLSQAASAAERSATANDLNSRSIDRYSGRLGLILKGVAILGPTIAPISVAAVAGLTAISAEATLAAAGVASVVVAFQGVGDALNKVNKAILDPTETNISNAQKAMAQLGPDAQAFVGRMAELKPILHELRDSAAAGFFPGMQVALDAFESAAPRLEGVLSGIAKMAGDLTAAGASSLASSRWSEFISFIGREAPPAMAQMAQAVGALTHGIAGLFMAFDPVNDSFLSWITRASVAFDDWANGLSRTKGFQEFLGYLHDTGPQLGAALGAIANAILQIVEAAAPLGGPVLRIITDLANAIAAIADSPLGTPIMAGVTALSALSLAASAGTAAVGRLTAGMTALGIASATAATEATAAAEAAALSSGAAATKGRMPIIAGGPAGIAGIVGLQALPDAWSNLQMMLNGERGIPEGLARMVAGLSPAGETLHLFGIDLFDAGEKAKETAEDADILAHSLDVASSQAAVAAFNNKKLADSWSQPLIRQLHFADRQARLLKVIQDQNKAVRASADSWLDYSGKVKLAGPSLATIERRWHRIGTAAQAEGDNIRAALKKGVDPAVIQDLINRLGPQGAAGAIAELANVTKAKAKEINAAFDSMRGHVEKGYGGGLRAAVEAATGARAAARHLGDLVGTTHIDADTTDFDAKGKHVRNDMDEFDHLNAIPSVSLDDAAFERRLAHVSDRLKNTNATVAEATVDLDTGPYDGKSRRVHNDLAEFNHLNGIPTIGVNDHATGILSSALHLLFQVDGFHASSTIETTVITNRQVNVIGDTSGGPAAVGPGGADGRTVAGPRQPYGDKLLMPVAPGEEVTSNRYGQADRHRQLLKAINAWRPGQPDIRPRQRGLADGGTAGIVRPINRPRYPESVATRSRGSERPIGSTSGTTTVIHRHVHELRMTGALDAKRGLVHIDERIITLSSDQIDQAREFERTQRG